VLKLSNNIYSCYKNEGGEALEAFYMYRENIGVSDSAGDHEMF
jgi:hypothetical protein